MNEAVRRMLDRYECNDQSDYENALKEIIQEIVLLGLWRTKFFEKGAFYGGTALRILYGLDRFSENLDFSLLEPDDNLEIMPYLKGIQTELESFGMSATIQKTEKTKQSSIESGFIKTNTLENLLLFQAPKSILNRIHKNQLIKIRMELDTDPPLSFETEAKYLLQPIPFSVKTYKLPFLFAGKCHAVLCRQWQKRVKGRDWYDLVWFIGNNTPLSIKHLEKRMQQTNHLNINESLTEDRFVDLFHQKIESVDFKQAGKDVEPFLKDPMATKVWSSEFFKEIIQRIQFQ
jgi:predicted nucleotidyltransferase component of viral defense system